jgi:uncharacterized protein YueI
MGKEDVMDYLKRGMYGTPELKPEEKKRYLGEFRERVVLALTQRQVRGKDIPRQVHEALDAYRNITIVLNGDMEYEAIGKYIRLANARNVPYRKVHDQQHETEIGLVIASPVPVDVPCVELSDGDAGLADTNNAAPSGSDKPDRGSRRGIAKKLKSALRRKHDHV